jgi:hypothetical protein
MGLLLFWKAELVIQCLNRTEPLKSVWWSGTLLKNQPHVPAWMIPAAYVWYNRVLTLHQLGIPVRCAVGATSVKCAIRILALYTS